MSLKEKVVEWGVLRALKEMCENEIQSLSPYHKRVVAYVNQIHREKVLPNLDSPLTGLAEPRSVPDVVDPDDCCHIGDVIYHLQCTGMNLKAAASILLEAAQKVENDKG